MNSTLFDPWRRLIGLVMVVALLVSGGAWLMTGPVAGAATGSTMTWSTVSPATAPPPLAYASMAYDSDNGTVVLFGGKRADGSLSSDTWVWNGSTWNRSASSVPARQSASMAFDPALHQLILFGGEGDSGQLLNDTWAWNGASWYQETAQDTTSAPPARDGATLAFDADDQLVLFGGTSNTSAAAGGTADALTPPAASASPADAAAAANLSDASSAATLADTWVWTGSIWSQQSVTGPPGRTDATMAWDPPRRQSVLFGGSVAPLGTTPPSGMLGDTWVWGAGAWSPVTPAASPTPRQDAILVADDDLGGLVAFGGTSGAGLSGDTWLWNGQTWSQLTPTTSPAPREGAAAAYDSAAHQLVLFGGVTGGGTVVGDTEILTTKAPAVPGGTTTEPTSGGHGNPTSTPRSSAAPTTPGGAKRTPTGSLGTGSATTSPPVRASTGSPRQVRRGDLVTLSGAGFRPGTPITITFHSTPYLVGRTTANGEGEFLATVAVPTAASAGLHHFEAIGIGVAGVMISLSTPVQVVAAVLHHGTLAQTLTLVAVAIFLPVGTWLVMAFETRRRRLSVEA